MGPAHFLSCFFWRIEIALHIFSVYPTHSASNELSKISIQFINKNVKSCIINKECIIFSLNRENNFLFY